MTIDWLLILNILLEGFTWGAGLSLAIVLCLVLVPKWVSKNSSRGKTNVWNEPV